MKALIVLTIITCFTSTGFPFEEIAKKVLNGKAPNGQKGKLEKAYYEAIQFTMGERLLELYSSEDTQVVMSGFVPHKTNASPERLNSNGMLTGQDMGSGLSIVKKYSKTTQDGKVIDTYVNELWPVRKGFIQLPDEIRVRTRTFNLKENSSRGDYAKAHDYIYARYRVSWTDTQPSKPNFYVQVSYMDNNEVSRKTQQKVRLGPDTCLVCHGLNQKTKNILDYKIKPFLLPGEKPFYESVVQPKYYGLKVEDTKGYKNLISYLKDEDFSDRIISKMNSSLLAQNQIESTEKELKRPLLENEKNDLKKKNLRDLFQLPSILSFLKKMSEKRMSNFMFDDVKIISPERPSLDNPFHYQDGQNIWYKESLWSVPEHLDRFDRWTWEGPTIPEKDPEDWY